MKVGFSCQLCLERGCHVGFLQGVKDEGAEKRLISQERTMSVFYNLWKQLHPLDAEGLCESGLGPLCGPLWCDFEALCMCVSSGDVSLLHSISQL